MLTISNIQNPHALPLFKDMPTARRAREKARQDPIKSHRPEEPQTGVGFGGRLGSSLTASIMKDLVQKTEIESDPREALFKYHQEGGMFDNSPKCDANFILESSKWFKAYEETQPKPIFREEDPEEEEKK